MFDFLKKKSRETPDKLLDKVQMYADNVEVVDDISTFRIATIDAVAEYNSMKLDARESRNDELFQVLMPFSEYFLKKTLADAFACAKRRVSNMPLWMHISGFDDKEKYYDTYCALDRNEATIHITKSIKVEDVSYTFPEEIMEWQYFYMLVEWLPEQLRKYGLDVQPKLRYGYASSDNGGWDDAMESITFIVSWADDGFEEHLSKVCDVSQADAYKAGVPLEDIVA